MRKLLTSALAGAAAMFLAAPAVAAPAPDIAESLPHPYEIEEAGDKLGAAIGAIVNVPIGDVVRTIDPASPVRRDSTIADVAGQGDPYFQERLRDQVSGATLKAADMVRGLAVAAPALQRSLDQLTRNLERALGDLGR